MNDQEFEVPWGQPLMELMLEAEPKKRGEHLQRVESLIFDRLQQPVQGGDGGAQWAAVGDALAILRAIKREKLGFPDWE
jgi:hypothetical protein